MTFAGVPRWAAALLWLLIVIVAIIIVGVVVHALGGFSWDVRIGYFHLLLGVG